MCLYFAVLKFFFLYLYGSAVNGKHFVLPFLHSKTISDPHGRFVIVKGQIHNLNIVLENIYAPNWDSDAFFKWFFSVLPVIFSLSLKWRLQLLSGYWTRLLLHCPVPSKFAKVIRPFMEEFNVSDHWRFFNPKRIHCDSVHLWPYSSFWQCISFRTVNFVFGQIDLFLSVNKTQGISPLILWETLKVFLRGEIMITQNNNSLSWTRLIWNVKIRGVQRHILPYRLNIMSLCCNIPLSFSFIQGPHFMNGEIELASC